MHLDIRASRAEGNHRVEVLPPSGYGSKSSQHSRERSMITSSSIRAHSLNANRYRYTSYSQCLLAVPKSQWLWLEHPMTPVAIRTFLNEAGSVTYMTSGVSNL